MKVDLRPLYEFGFDEKMALIFITLLDLGRATIKLIQTRLLPNQPLSYSQVRHGLQKLIEVKAVEHQKGLEDTFSPVNPVSLFEVFQKKFLERSTILQRDLTDKYERATHSFGQCTLHVNRFLFSSVELGLKIITDRFITPATNSIQFLATPPILFRRLQWTLQGAYGRGVGIEIHYSQRDFEESPNYDSEIRSLCKNFRFTLVAREFRTHEALAFNDEYTRVGSLIVDKNHFISFPYYRAKEIGRSDLYEIDFFEGFSHNPGITESMITTLLENPITQMSEQIPPRESAMLEFLKHNPATPKSEISQRLGIAGTDLRETLDRLERFGLLKIERRKKGAGRPVEVVSLSVG